MQTYLSVSSQLSMFMKNARSVLGNNKRLALTFMAMIGAFFTATAFSIPVPQATDMGYAVYDVVVNKIINGPFGFAGGVILIAWGAVQITKNWMITLGCVLAGSGIIQAESIVTSLGMSISLI